MCSSLIWQVCSDIVHYDNGAQAGKPCQLVYYPMRFKAFQTHRPEIVAALPTAEKAMATLATVADGGGGATKRPEAAVDGGLDSQIRRVEELMASGQILPIRFPDPGKPEGIRTYRKPIMTLKSISFKYDGTEREVR